MFWEAKLRPKGMYFESQHPVVDAEKLLLGALLDPEAFEAFRK
jgi:hypothetical protein